MSENPNKHGKLLLCGITGELSQDLLDRMDIEEYMDIEKMFIENLFCSLGKNQISGNINFKKRATYRTYMYKYEIEMAVFNRYDFIEMIKGIKRIMSKTKDEDLINEMKSHLNSFLGEYNNEGI